VRRLPLITVRNPVVIMIAALALAMTGLLAACGGSSTPATTSAASSTSSSTSAPATSSTSSPGASEAACDLMTLSEAQTITGDTSGSLVPIPAAEMADFGGKTGVCWYWDPAAARTSAWAFEGSAPSGTSAATVAAAVIQDTGFTTGFNANNPFGFPCSSWQAVSGIGEVAYACASSEYVGYALAFVKHSTLVVGGLYCPNTPAGAALQDANLKHWAQGAASSL